jgi:hypothetical protein
MIVNVSRFVVCYTPPDLQLVQQDQVADLKRERGEHGGEHDHGVP